MELAIEHTGGSCYRQRGDDDGNNVSNIKPERYRESPMHSGSLSGTDVESAVQQLMGSLKCISSAVPRRFGMDDIVDIDEDDIAALEASLEWRDFLPHVRRSVLAEQRMSAVGRIHFVPRMIRSRPGTAYAVRYWKGLSNVQSLTAALGIVAAAWQMCQPPEPERVSNTHRKEDGTHKPVVGASSEAGHGPERFPAPLPGGISEQKKPSPAVTCEVTGQEQKASHHRGSTDGSSSREDVPIVLDASTVATKAHGGQTENSKDAGGAKEKAGIIDGDHKVQTSSSPSDCQSSTAVTLTKKKRRANPLLLGVIGFAAEWDSSSRQACVALIGDWPGIGSLQDLLEGKTAMRRTSQEDLITWTRQVAKGLVKICSSSGGGTSRTTASARGKLLLRISARNVYLFPKPKSEFSQEPKGVLDARVAMFLGPPLHNSPAEQDDAYPLLPPECILTRSGGGSPTGGDIPPTPLKAKTAQTGEEPADVWGMGTLVFELATAQIAGPTPLAARSLRDLLRAVPIGPRFLYGDLARAVMQLSFRKEPRERATAVQIAAIVEETATRTLRRAHTASDRQTCLLRAERRALESAEVSAGQDHDENAGDDADGYGQAVQIWSIKQAVERAKGRARAFLRQLWFDSLTEDDKRRVRHKRRYRKINENAKKARRRRVRAAVMHHWTPVEVATWAGGILHQAEIRGCLPLVSSGDAKGGIAVMRGNGDRNRQGSDATPDIGKPTTRELSSDGSVGEKQDQQQQQQQQQQEEQHKQHQQQQEQHQQQQQQQQQQRQKQQHQQQHQHSDPAAGIGNENDSSGGADSSDNAHNGRDDRPDIVTDGMTSAQVGDGHGDNMASNQGAAWDKKDKNDGDSISSGGGSSAVDGDDDWASVDAAARKGYAGVIVEPAAMAKGVYGSCLVEAMEAAHTRAEDALTRFVKGSVRLPKPAEVETRRVALMVRELLTTRPNSAPGQIQMRAWLEVVVRSAEAPRDLVDGQIEAQLPALTRVLTAGYRRQVALAEEGRHLAAARLQGLARGAHARSLVSSIWRQADEFAADIIQGERETRRRAEIAQRAREKEEAAAREKEEAERYRLRLVPRASSVKCRSMEVSLPSFLVEATRGSRRFFVMEVTVSHPPALPTSPSTIGNYAWSFDEDDVDAIGRIHVLLREDSTVELEDSTHTAEGRNLETNVDQFVEVCSAGDTLPILALIPATTYRLTLELPHSARDYLLQSARALGVSAAVRALESAADSIAIGTDHEDVNHAAPPVALPTHRRECGSVNGAYVDVVIPPDVPGVPRLICKVLTSASAVDLNDPDGVLSLRQWQSPYPGIAEMDGPCSPENMVLAPGRPEAIVSLRWTAPESNGLSICSYHVERRIGSTGGTWTRISTRRSDGGSGDGSGGGRGAKTAMSSLDAVDTPLKTIALDTLKDVALRCLMLEYRVIAENTLGVGAPSPPVEVSINAFLGHLRAHARAARHQDMPALLSSSLTRAAPEPRHGFKSGGLLHTGTAAAAAAAAAADSYAEPAKNCDLALPRTEQHQQVQEIGDDQRHVASPPNGITMNATNAADATTARAPAQAGTREEAFFGDDFLGLRNFGEDRVHSLFAVGTTTTAEQASSSPRRSDATNKIRGGAVAPAGTTAAAPSFTTQSTLSPRFLPPIVGSTVSGAWGPGKKGHCYSRKGGNGDEKTFAAQLPGDDGGDEIGDDESGERLASGCADGGAPNNEVFHAFLNLGRRLPGRRRRNLGSSAQ